MQDELASHFRFKMSLGMNDRLYNKSLESQFFKDFKCPIKLNTSFSADDVMANTLKSNSPIP